MESCNCFCIKQQQHKHIKRYQLKFGGVPILATDDYYTDCIHDKARGLVCADSYRDRRMLMREIAEAVLAGTCPDGKLYYVSKTWLQQWLRRKTIDSPCEADSGPTASIRCPHGKLCPRKQLVLGAF